ncbi:MAG: iron-containing alcohol dehydrogenase [Oscillospiraceae bacterium]|nr:iron-containing alcohol dehydrogenase [Oscillospiraceae bacterium]
MAIREESFRIGCGRYIQGKGYIARLHNEVARVGTRPLVIGDDTTVAITREKITASLQGAGIDFGIYTHNGTCNHEDAKILAEYAVKEGFDVIVGAGGGVIMDFAKLCAYYAALPVINIPTSSATCASYAPLSVCYTREGRTVGTHHYEYEVDAVIADTEILAAQPANLFLAGVFDALAKYVEIKHRYSEGDESYPMGLDYAYVMAKRSFSLLTEKAAGCLESMAKGEITEEFENVIFTVIAATGVISGIARGSNQTALAHKFYEMTRRLFPETARPYLHGEIVGVGLLLQNHYNGEEEANEYLLGLMKKYHMPCCAADVGVEMTDEVFEDYYARICDSSAIDKNDAAMCERFRKSLTYFWNIQRGENV